MKLKTFLASVSACAIAVSAMAITASAEVTNGNTTGDDGKKFYVYDLLAEGADVTAVYGVKVEMTVSDWSEGCGGGFGFNSESTGWKSIEWGNADASKAISIDDNGDFTYTATNALFATSDTYCQIWIQNWWGGEVTVDNITLLGADGKALGGATTDAPASSDDDATTTTTTTAASGSSTGDAGIALAVAGLAVAGAAAYVARKKD